MKKEVKELKRYIKQLEHMVIAKSRMISALENELDKEMHVTCPACSKMLKCNYTAQQKSGVCWDCKEVIYEQR